jgi:uncharacterized protein (TIGR02246 family)
LFVQERRKSVNRREERYHDELLAIRVALTDFDHSGDHMGSSFSSSPEEQIRNTLARYAQVHDKRDVDGYAALFAEEGCLAVMSGGRFVGRPAVREFMSNYYANQSPTSRTKHVYVNSVIELHADDTADVTSDVVAYRCDADGVWGINSIGIAIDKLVFRDGSWLFLERQNINLRAAG